MVSKGGNKIVLLSHSCEDTTGIDDELVKFLLENDYKNIVHIQFPFTFSRRKAIKVKLIHSGEISEHQSLIKFYKPEILSYMKDFIYAIIYGIHYCRGAKVLIASNNLLALAGIILKRFGLVEKVAYNMIDYTPIRYSNPLLNRLYYAIDRIACYRVDIVLPLIDQNILARANHGQLDLTKVKWRTMPFGNNSHLYHDADYNKFDLNKIVYFGGVIKSKGAELFVPIVKELIKAGFKKVKFQCIGGGEIESVLEEARAEDVESNFHFFGRIKDHREVESLLLECSVAIAPYFPEDKNNFSYYADPGKIKVYLGCGLPVVITDVPPIAKELEGKRAGLIAEYSAKDFANKILMILNPKNEYLVRRKLARQLGESYSWNKIFTPVIDELIS